MRRHTHLREALDAHTDHIGLDCHVKLQAKWSLAWILYDQISYLKAEQMSFETRVVQERTIGASHPGCIKISTPFHA